MANTTRDSVSDMTVAPTVTVTGSSRVSPSSVIIGSARRVCEASSDPNTTAVTGWYPNHIPTAMPRASGMPVVKRPKMIDRVRARRKRARSISSPAKNMSSSFPRSAKKFATAGCTGKTPDDMGANHDPAEQKPYNGWEAKLPRERRNAHNDRHRQGELRQVRQSQRVRAYEFKYSHCPASQ